MSVAFPLPIEARNPGSAQRTPQATLLGPGGRVQTADGTVFPNPSAAACSVEQGKGINGWRYWAARIQPGGRLTPLSELRQAFPDVFGVKKAVAQGQTVHLTSSDLDAESEEGDGRGMFDDHRACIRLWKDTLQQAGATVGQHERSVHPVDPRLPAAVFPLLQVKGSVEILLCSLRVLSRGLHDGWFRATVHEGQGQEGVALLLQASEDPDVCLHAQKLTTQQVQTICNEFVQRVLVRAGVAGRIRLDPPVASVKARILSNEPHVSLIRACVRFAASHCNTRFWFGQGSLRLEVHY